MTAIVDQPVRTPPRIVLQTFWLLHRTLYRISGGRIGLSRPEAGQRFGMMRLHSVGRRTGRSRVAIVGYYEDLANLVTLAMNGWADTDPAWWQNLRAHPDTTVELPDGSRGVRARAATGAERERLWARFHEFPGWGEFMDTLAEQRSNPTEVVVLEPRVASTADEGGASRPDPVVRLEAVKPPVASSQPEPSRIENVEPTSTVDGGRRIRLAFRPRRRHLWLVPGLAIGLYAGSLAAQFEVGLVPLLVFGIVPHLTVLLGYGQPHADGQLAPRAVPLFNAMHHPIPPLVLLAVAAAGLLSPFWLVGAVAWISHIVVDWSLGDGLRDREGFLSRTVTGILRPGGTAV